MPRLLFEKKGRAVWISHLDLMRLFQRSFKRAGLPLTHTHGFNPRPSVSIALPLSVGVESSCELLDFDIDGESTDYDSIRNRLNRALTEGIKVLEVYENGQKIKYLTVLRCIVTLEYDRAIPEDSVDRIASLFTGKELILPKKTKSGIQDQDIIPMIKDISVSRGEGQSIILDCRICCQNPTLNPMQLPLAVETFLPELAPDFSFCRRVEVYDSDGKVFR